MFLVSFFALFWLIALFEIILIILQIQALHDSSAWYRAMGVRGLAWFCMVCSGSASFLGLCCYRYWIKVVCLRPCIDDGNLWRSWEWWLLFALMSLFRFLFIIRLSRMVEFGWISGLIWARPQEAGSLRHPNPKYYWETLPCPGRRYRDYPAPSAHSLPWRPQAGFRPGSATRYHKVYVIFVRLNFCREFVSWKPFYFKLKRLLQTKGNTWKWLSVQFKTRVVSF
jgi:hypothetical protein